MSAATRPSPAGTPCTTTTPAGPCDSPAVEKPNLTAAPSLLDALDQSFQRLILNYPRSKGRLRPAEVAAAIEEASTAAVPTSTPTTTSGALFIAVEDAVAVGIWVVRVKTSAVFLLVAKAIAVGVEAARSATAASSRCLAGRGVLGCRRLRGRCRLPWGGEELPEGVLALVGGVGLRVAVFDLGGKGI